MRTHILGRDIFMEGIARGGSSATLAPDARSVALDVTSVTPLSGAQRCTSAVPRVEEPDPRGRTHNRPGTLNAMQIKGHFRSRSIWIPIRVQLTGLHLTRLCWEPVVPVLHPPTNRTPWDGSSAARTRRTKT